MVFEPERYLADHPWAHALSLLGAGGTCVAATVIAVRADERGTRLGYGLLALWTASHTVGLALIRRRVARQRRFSELTGLDPDDPFDLVTAWWLTRSARGDRAG